MPKARNLNAPRHLRGDDKNRRGNVNGSDFMIHSRPRPYQCGQKFALHHDRMYWLTRQIVSRSEEFKMDTL
jgi:hypothetical protein